MNAIKSLGRHIKIELYGCDLCQITDTSWLKEIALTAAIAEGATIVEAGHGKARNEGYFANVTIAESHVIINTFPAVYGASLEAFTCGDTIDPRKIVEKIAELIKHDSVSEPIGYFRGTLGDGQTDIHHKPTAAPEDT